MALKNGAKVQLIQPVISGEVVGGTFIDGTPCYEVSYTGQDGEVHTGYFPEEKLQEITNTSASAGA